MIFRFLAATLTMASLASCMSGHEDGVARLGANPALTGGTYSIGGGITIASEFRNQGGRVALCGVWAESERQTFYTKGKARDVLASGAVYLGGNRVIIGLNFLRKTAPTTSYTDLKAGCSMTLVPWRAEYAGRVPDIRLPEQNANRDYGIGAKPIVRFRQTGPGALTGSLDIIQTLFRPKVRMPLGQNPPQAAGQYSTGGGVRAAAELRQVGNAAYVCGAWSQSKRQSPRTEKQAPEVLARGHVSANGKPVLRDLGFFRHIASQRPFEGIMAHCKDTGLAWDGAFDPASVQVHLPEMVVYPGPGTQVIFMPK